MGGREAVGHVDANQAVGDRPQHEVVVKGTVAVAFVAPDEAAAVNEEEDRARGGVYGLRGEDVQAVARVVTVVRVAQNADIGIGLTRLQRCVHRAGFGGFDDGADLLQTGGDGSGYLRGDAGRVHGGLR